MITYDMIASFAIPVIVGFFLLTSNTDVGMKYLKKCYKKALDKWNVY